MNEFLRLFLKSKKILLSSDTNKETFNLIGIKYFIFVFDIDYTTFD
jgi:hypothetical protein